MLRNWHYYASIFETQLVENESMTIVVPPVKVEILSGPATIIPLSHGRAVLPLRGELGEELRIPSLASVYLDESKRYVVLTTRTRERRELAGRECEDAIHRVIAMLSIIYRPFVFASPVWSGWVRAADEAYTDAQVLFSPPQLWEQRSVQQQISHARAALAKDATLRRRFGLMARLFNRATALPPGEECFLWLWTCLEVYPMVDTTDIAPIAQTLTEYLNVSAGEIKTRLEIGRLFGMRSRLVHDGSIGVPERELYEHLTRLQLIVFTILRQMCQMTYDGELDRWLNPSLA